ncbi:MAG: hypothetical protein HC787_00835 [Nostocaceae cyanobacterium CSU_2_110]|nr:hypothetical protein [Nostocaceae cyanobacterium CSU_2_110]
MKLKKLSLFASAIAVAFSITPLAANAQVNSNTNAPQRVSQATPQKPPELKLSEQQINKINQIRSTTRNKIQSVLTEQQRQKSKPICKQVLILNKFLRPFSLPSNSKVNCKILW